MLVIIPEGTNQIGRFDESSLRTINGLPVSKSRKYDILPLYGVDTPIIPHLQPPCIRNAGEFSHIALRPSPSRVLRKKLKDRSKPLLSFSGEVPEFPLCAVGEEYFVVRQSLTSELELFSDFGPGPSLLSTQASQMLKEELLWRVNGQEVIDEIVVGCSSHFVSSKFVQRLLADGNAGVFWRRCHYIN